MTGKTTAVTQVLSTTTTESFAVQIKQIGEAKTLVRQHQGILWKVPASSIVSMMEKTIAVTQVLSTTTIEWFVVQIKRIGETKTLVRQHRGASWKVLVSSIVSTMEKITAVTQVLSTTTTEWFVVQIKQIGEAKTLVRRHQGIFWKVLVSSIVSMMEKTTAVTQVLSTTTAELFVVQVKQIGEAKTHVRQHQVTLRKVLVSSIVNMMEKTTAATQVLSPTTTVSFVDQ